MAMTEKMPSCTQSAPGPIGPRPELDSVQSEQPGKGEVPRMSARVGKEAPDFETSAFVDGGFKNIKLSDYRGQWVVICFYPGDFTFV